MFVCCVSLSLVDGPVKKQLDPRRKKFANAYEIANFAGAPTNTIGKKLNAMNSMMSPTDNDIMNPMSRFFHDSVIKADSSDENCEESEEDGPPGSDDKRPRFEASPPPAPLSRSTSGFDCS